MIDFVGAGPGAVDLITVRGMELIRNADVIIYAGSLVNPALLEYAQEGTEIHDSSRMTLEEVLDVMTRAESEGRRTVRLHTGDASVYGAIREQMDELDKRGIPYRTCPGVSAAFGAAASLNLEYTLPGVSQTLIITRMEGRTAVPENERIELLASHGSSMAIYLSAGMLKELARRLVAGGYAEDTPVAVVYKATWPDEKRIICTLKTMADEAEKAGVRKTAVVLVGNVIVNSGYERSKLYDPSFTTEFRQAKE
ncbi:MAG: precorrin-4 C(11)-methyltransferase [Lachnospiraceae bacterium]|nr:precorrin-4 C(11)-methyltransferase [Lachnospiraceae bacterium]